MSYIRDLASNYRTNRKKEDSKGSSSTDSKGKSSTKSSEEVQYQARVDAIERLKNGTEFYPTLVHTARQRAGEQKQENFKNTTTRLDSAVTDKSALSTHTKKNTSTVSAGASLSAINSAKSANSGKLVKRNDYSNVTADKTLLEKAEEPLTEKEATRRKAYSIYNGMDDDTYNKANEAYENADKFISTPGTAQRQINAVASVLTDSGMDKDKAMSYARNWRTVRDAKGIVDEARNEHEVNNRVESLSDEQYRAIGNYIARTDTGYYYDHPELTDKSTPYYVQYEDGKTLKKNIMSDYGMTEEEFDSYVDAVKSKLDRESTEEEINKRMENMDNTVWATPRYNIEALATGFIADGVAASATAIDKLLGRDINTYSRAYRQQRINTAVEQKTAEQFAELVGKLGGGETAQNVAAGAYSVGNSIIKSKMAMDIGTGVADSLELARGSSAYRNVASLTNSGLFSASAFSNSVRESKEAGLSDEQALRTGVANGINESLMEYLSFDKVLELLDKPGKVSVKEGIKRFTGAMFAEGSEELNTDFANAIADHLMNGEFNDTKNQVNYLVANGMDEEEAKDQVWRDTLRQWTEDFVAGAVSGGVFAGGRIASNNINYHNLAENVSDDLKLQLAETSKTMDEGTTAREIADSKPVEEWTTGDTAKVLQSMEEVAGDRGSYEEILAHEIEQTGKSESEALAIAQDMVKAASTPADETTEEDSNRRIETWDEDTQETYGKFLKGELTKEHDTIVNAYDEREDLRRSKAESKRINKRTTVARATDRTSNDSVIAVKISDITKSDARVMLSDGSITKLSAIKFDDRQTQQLYNLASTFDSANAANAFIEEYPGGDMATYARSVMAFYNAGKNGAKSFDSLMSDSQNGIYAAVDSSINQTFYELGVNDKTPVKAVTKPQADNVSRGKVIDQRTEVTPDSDFVTRVASVLSNADYENTVIKDTKLDNNARGEFNRILAEVAITTDSDNPLSAVVHEHIGEVSRAYNAEGWDKVVDEVMDYMYSKEGMQWVNNRVSTYREAYKKVSSDTDNRDAATEFVNDVIGEIFTTEEGLEHLMNHAQEKLTEKEQKSFIQSIKDFFNNMIKSLKDYMESHSRRFSMSEYLKASKQLEKIRDDALAAWDKAIENRKREMSGENSNTAKADKKAYSLNPNPDTKVEVDKEGIVIITGSRYSVSQVTKDFRNVAKNIRSELSKLVGNSYVIKADNREVHIGADFVGEYSGSKDTQKSRKDVKRTKANAIPGIEKIIENADNPKYLQNDEEKHNNDARRGWTRYDVTFGLSDGSVVNYFRGFLNIRMAADGKDYVYDITKINKLKNGPHIRQATNNSAYDNSGIHKENISSNKENVNKRYSLNLENEGKKYSTNIDEALFEALEETWELEEQKQAAGIVQQGFEALQSVEINDKIVNKIAKNILKQYSSDYSTEDLSYNIKNIFAYLKNTENVSFDDMTKVMQEVAKPVLEQSKKIDPRDKEDYDNFINFISQKRIKLTSAQRQEIEYTYGSYEDFRKSMFGKLTLSNKGVSLDDIWSEIVQQSGYRLSEDVNDADEIVALTGLIEDMKPAPRNPFGMNMDDAAYDVALDIYRQFFIEQAAEKANEKVKKVIGKKTDELIAKQQQYRRTYGQKYKEALENERRKTEEMQKASIKRLQREFYQLDQAERDAIRESDLISQAVIKAEREKYENRLRRLRNQKNERIAEINARNAYSRTRAAQQRKATYLKEGIRKNMDALNSMLMHPNENKHIPAGMVRSVIDVCEAVNVDTGKSRLMKEKLEKLQDFYKSYRNDQQFEFDYDERIDNDIDTLKNMFAGRNYTELTNDELQRVYNIISALKQQISNANKLIDNKLVKDAHEGAKQAVSEITKAKRHANNMVTAQLDKFASYHLNAYREFRKLSGYKDNSVLMSIYDELERGQQKELEIQRHVNDAFLGLLQSNRKEAMRLESYKPDDLVDIGLKDENGKPVMVTRAMRLSVIMHSYNKGNMNHVLNEGLTIPDIKLYEKGKIKEAWEKAKTYRYVSYELMLDAIKSKDSERLTAEQAKYERSVRKLESDLSDFEKEFLKIAKEVFHNYFGKEINKVTMQTRGYAAARVENYYPIKTDPDFTHSNFGGLVMDSSLEGMGMLKERVRSKNPILLEDITKVVIRQANNTSKYVGYAIPIRNFNMLMNSTYHDNNGRIRNMKETVRNVWGNSNEKYLENIFKDIQGANSSGGSMFDGVLNALRGNFAGATLSANVGVAMKQAASYPTAAAVVGYGPLLKAMKDIPKGFNLKKGIPELEKRNSLLWVRSQGYSNERVADATKLTATKSKLREKADMIGFMDAGTVRTLEYASMYYVDSKFKNLEKGSDEYWNKVSETFTKVVFETQPNYTTLQQAAVTRDPSSAKKLFFMFKTQSLQNMGIMYDAIGNFMAKTADYRDAKKSKNAEFIASTKKEVKVAANNLAHATSSQIIAAAVFKAMDFLSKIFYHRQDKFQDDDGNWDMKKIEDFFVYGIINTLAGGILLGDEIVEGLESFFLDETYYGAEVSILEMWNDFNEGMQSLKNNLNKMHDSATDEEHDEYSYKVEKSILTIANVLGQIKGVPVNNIFNTFNSAYTYVMGTGIMDGDIENQYDRVLDAYLDGDMDEYNRLLEQKANTLSNPDSAKTGVKNKAKERYLDGEITREQTEGMLKELGDESPSLTIEGWNYKSEGKDFKPYELMVDAYLEGNMDEYDRLYELKADTLSDPNSANGEIKKVIKKRYLSGEMSESQTEDMLNEIGDEEPYFTMEGWKYTEETGEQYSQYVEVDNAINDALENQDRQAVIDSVQSLIDHGVDVGDIESHITKKFKPIYLDSEYKADLKSYLITAYEYCGKTRTEAIKKIEDWEK